jgi:hypothetical protein
MSKDPKALLREDHGEIRTLLREFEKAGERAGAVKEQLIERILAAALRAHGHRGVLPRT